MGNQSLFAPYFAREIGKSISHFSDQNKIQQPKRAKVCRPKLRLKVDINTITQRNGDIQQPKTSSGYIDDGPFDSRKVPHKGQKNQNCYSEWQDFRDAGGLSKIANQNK